MGVVSRTVRIVVLCEDVQHEAFIRRFMKKIGWNTRDLRVEKASSGRGSAEQFVRERFPAELRTLRSKGGEQAYLIVMVDGDDRGVAARKASLATGCGETGIAPPGDADHVLICVPTWNVETWLSYLAGATVDERRADYPRLSGPGDCMPMVDELVAMCRRGVLRTPFPPSLDDTCSRYQRLFG